MKNEQDKNNQSSISPRDSFNLLVLLVSAHRLCILPFIRRDFGPRAFGMPGVAAAVMMLIYGSLAGAPVMINYMWVWFVFVLAQKALTTFKIRRGWVVHSEYQGRPWLAMKFPLTKSESQGHNLEPFICLFGGVLLCPLSKPVGAFVMFGFVTFIIYIVIERTLIEARNRRIRDAQIEQRIQAARLRGDTDGF